MRNVLLALMLLCLSVLAGGQAMACPQMEGQGPRIVAAEAEARVAPHSHGEAAEGVVAPVNCHHGSGSSSCADLHACCAIPLLKAPVATVHRWPTRVSYAARPPQDVRPVPALALDRPPKIQA